MPVTTEGDPIILVDARWRVRRETATQALKRCEHCLDDGGGSFTWIASREALAALQPDPMPRGAALVETQVLGLPDMVTLGQFSLKRDTLLYEGLSERRLAWSIDLITELLPDAKLLGTTAEPPEQASQRRRKPPNPPNRSHPNCSPSHASI